MNEDLNKNENEIIDSIKKYDGIFPKQHIQNAIDMGITIEPDLLKILEDVIEHVKTDSVCDEDWQSFVISSYLLAKLRSITAYKYFIETCKLSDEYLDLLLGDSLTEGLHQLLGSTFNGDLDSLSKIIFDDKLNVFARDAAVRSYLVLLKNQIITREKLISDFKNIFLKINQKDFIFRGCLISNCLNIYADELIDEILSSFKNNLVDESIVDLSDVKRHFKKDKSKIIYEFLNDEHNNLIDDPIKEMDWWHCWEENETDHSFTPSGNEFLTESLKHLLHSKINVLDSGIKQKKEKIGRNDRCPCNSGLKYKKCCLLLSPPLSKKLAVSQNKR